MTLSGRDLFVLDTTTRSAAQCLNGSAREGNLGPAYQFDEPRGVAVSGHDLFVANYAGGPYGMGSVTEAQRLDGGVG